MAIGRTSAKTMRRLLLSIDGEPCRFGCSYCFAQFSQYDPPRTLSEVEADPTLINEVDVLYPACDTDLFARRDFENVLARLSVYGRSVSISTKASIGRRAIGALTDLQASLAPAGAAVKVGVSISTKYRVAEIEPRTPGYESRIRSLARLKAAEIPSALVLRPLLADVTDREYEEILSDCATLTSRVLVGDEWLDATDRFRTARGSDANPVIGFRTVNWASDLPIWRQRSIPGRVAGLMRVGNALGYDFFESDLEVMGDVLGNP